MVSGQYTGTKDFVNLVGSSDSVPYINAKCLHVWKTGSADLQEFTDQPAWGFLIFRQWKEPFVWESPSSHLSFSTANKQLQYYHLLTGLILSQGFSLSRRPV